MESSLSKLAKFNIVGLDLEVSTEDTDKLSKIDSKLDYYNRHLTVHGRDAYILEVLSDINQENLLKRAGSFRNSKGWIVDILGSYKRPDKARFIKLRFARRGGSYFVTEIHRFFDIVASGDFHNFSQPGVVAKVKDKIAELEAERDAILDKYNEIYNIKKAELEANYNADAGKFAHIEKEGKSQRRELSSEEALEVSKNYKGVEKIKNYWNSYLSKEDKARLIGWLCGNIYSIRVYGVTCGRSGNVLATEYGDDMGIKFRDIEKNDRGEITSRDSIVAHISVMNAKECPANVRAILTTIASKEGDPFWQNRINNKNLALFLLSEYGKYGFRAGVRKLMSQLNVEALRANEFGDVEEAFNDGLYPF